MTGGCYIGPGGPYQEQLTNLTPGCTAVFRYVKSSDAYTAVRVEAEGSGTIELRLGGVSAGVVTIENGVQKNRALRAPAGEYELELRILQADGLTLQKLTLY